MRMDVDGAIEEKHKMWQQQATLEGQKMKKTLLDKDAAVDYACQHPTETGSQVEIASKHSMSKFAIDMARKRKMQKEEDYDLNNIIDSKKHHLLGNEGERILIFGDDKAVQRLAATKAIQADGTFTCVIPSFSQLYIFHATVENNVSIPVLFCLLKGKNA